MRAIIPDTNIIIRFLVRDDLHLFEQAKLIISEAENGKYQLFLDEVIIAEIVWVLTSNYDLTRQKIASSLTYLLAQSWIVNPRKALIIKTVSLFGGTNLSYVDCWIKTISENKKFDLYTFDKELLKQL